MKRSIEGDASVGDRASRNLLLCACILEIFLGTTLACTHLPLCDEGFYGVPAHTLSTTGSLRNPVMESAGFKYLRGVDQNFYWMAPIGMMLQALIFSVFGFSLLVQREISVICGLGVILCWYMTLRWLLPHRVAALAALFLSIDFVFLSLASLGRSDMISLFLGSAALAAYMNLRERSLSLALVVSSGASALSTMAHPNGGIAATISLGTLCFFFDRARLRWGYLAMVTACYGLFCLGWLVYIAKAPDLFAAQFLGNVANRFAAHKSVIHLFTGEFARYVSAYGLEEAHGTKLLFCLVPMVYIAALIFCALSRGVRSEQTVRVLLVMFAGVSLSLVFIEGSKQGWYLVHLSPLLSAFLAISVTRLWRSDSILNRGGVALQIFIVLLGVARLSYTAGGQHLQKRYQPTIAYLNDHLGRGDLVFARSEFYFGLHCRTCLRDDPNLGILSGRRADYIVIDSDYSAHLATLLEANTSVYHDISTILDRDYRQVFSNENYRVLQRLKN